MKDVSGKKPKFTRCYDTEEDIWHKSSLSDKQLKAETALNHTFSTKKRKKTFGYTLRGFYCPKVVPYSPASIVYSIVKLYNCAGWSLHKT